MDHQDYIYFALAPALEAVRIGAAKDPESQLDALRATHPVPIVPLRYVAVEKGTRFEVQALLHEKFRDLNIRGDWFWVTEDLLQFCRDGDVPKAVADLVGDLPRAASLSLKELADQSGFTERTIRYYISQGILWPPDQVGRNASYSEAHLQRLQQVHEWRNQGLTIHQMKMLTNTKWAAPLGQGTVWKEYQIADDFRVFLRPGSPERTQQLTRYLLSLLAAMED